MKAIKYIGLDVHKKTIAIAIAEGKRNGEVRYYGTIDNTMAALKKVIRKLIADGSELRFVYEAGPCGYKLQSSRSSRIYFPILTTGNPLVLACRVKLYILVRGTFHAFARSRGVSLGVICVSMIFSFVLRDD